MDRQSFYVVESRGSHAGIETHGTRREASADAIRKVRYADDAACIGTVERVEVSGPNVRLVNHRVLRSLDAASPFVRRARAGLLPAKVVR